MPVRSVRAPWWRPRRLACGLAAGIAILVAAVVAHSEDTFDEEPIRYAATPAHDPVSRLQDRLDRGEATLRRTPKHGYLQSVLWQLGIPASSQMLVFSKTSVQRDHISPATPRALYFGEATYVGWVQDGDVLEVASTDPQLGAVFYTLNQYEPGPPRFQRRTYECLQCHASGRTLDIPGHLMRSVFTDPTGEPIVPAGSFLTTDESPMQERWGGWYVTGQHGQQYHLGNQTFRTLAEAEKPNLKAGANLPDLKGRISTTAYLTPYSDIVALMVAEHQVRVENLIIRANHETRRALQYDRLLSRELGRPSGEYLDSTRSRIRSVCEPLVRALLLVKAVPLTGKVTGTSGFAETFQSGGPRDGRKRSLRELDLRTRMFRYPCSYLIYSDLFAGLPALAKEYVYRRFAVVLQGKDASPEYAGLSPSDRKAVLEILRETKPEFGSYLEDRSQFVPAERGSSKIGEPNP